MARPFKSMPKKVPCLSSRWSASQSGVRCTPMQSMNSPSTSRDRKAAEVAAVACSRLSVQSEIDCTSLSSADPFPFQSKLEIRMTEGRKHGISARAKGSALSGGEGANMLTEHYVWRAIEQAKRIAERIDDNCDPRLSELSSATQRPEAGQSLGLALKARDKF